MEAMQNEQNGAEGSHLPDLLPVRMVNEYVYCPRLSYLMWVQGEWAASSDTVEGTQAHKRVDKRKGKLPAAAALEDDPHIHARSITLSSERLGIIAKLDLVEGEGGTVTPVDYKRGKRPHIEGGVWDPERVQLALQVLLLREHGYTCHEGVIYFVASKERYNGWFMGHTNGTGHKNVELRTAQYRASFNEAQCLHIAQGIVAAKIANCRTLLRRNWKDGDMPKELAHEFKQLIAKCERTESLAELLGIEGQGAARYFAHFNQMLSGQDNAVERFDFKVRNRRPPTDPVNALLSFGYAMLTRTMHQTLAAVGFDPYRGVYHQPRYGRPALALDLMEPFRPLIVDSAVIQVINNGEVSLSDLQQAGPALNLNERGKPSLPLSSAAWATK